MSNKQVTGSIASDLGHTDFTGSVADAVKTIVDSVKTNKMWAFFDNEPYFFTGNDAEDAGAIEGILDRAENPNFTLTGQLVGG